MIKIRYALLIAVICACSFIGKAQEPAFYNDIQNFKKKDSASAPPQNAILFVGSSSFTKWIDVQDYFPGYQIINRGFGGSTLPDVIRYVDDIIIPYHAKQIVIYCGENDLASSDTVSGEMVFQRFQELFKIIRKKNPSASVAFISLKPSPSRQHLWQQMEIANDEIRHYLSKKRKASFIDVYHKMFNRDGSVMQDIFLEDNLHMNAKGYQIWQKIIEPYLIKDEQ